MGHAGAVVIERPRLHEAADVGEVVVRFSSVCKSYDGETLAVRDLNLDVRQGEFLTLLGPSGSGKTTTLMMLAGFETPTSGDIIYGGRSITRVPPHKRNFGMVFQGYALFPHLTVLENVAYPLRMRKIGRAEAHSRARQALEMVRLREFEARYPAQLSGGQQQRVALARALVFDPFIVLMDEPLGALDKNLREQMQYEIKHIHETIGVTVVYVTHDQSEALTMSNRIAVFDDGVIQQLAPPAELYEKPQNAFVASFIGENNQLHGRVEEIKGDRCSVRLDEGSIVQALKVNVSSVGERTTLSLRPERIVTEPERGHYPNVFEARVEELIYLGDHIRTRVSVCGSHDFIVKIPNAHTHARLAQGETVRIGWSMEDCRALDAS